MTVVRALIALLFAGIGFVLGCGFALGWWMGNRGKKQIHLQQSDRNGNLPSTETEVRLHEPMRVVVVGQNTEETLKAISRALDQVRSVRAAIQAASGSSTTKES